MSLLFILPFLATAMDDAANTYVNQIEKRIMTVWHLPERSAGLTVGLRMNIEQSGNISDLRVIQSSGDEKFDASAIEAVRRAAPFQPVPLALKHLIGDLVIVLDPTPAAEREAPQGRKPPKLSAPRVPLRPSPKNRHGYEI
jgi:TonB family protein